MKAQNHRTSLEASLSVRFKSSVMKLAQLSAITAVSVGVLLAPSMASASIKSTCKVVTEDVGTIIGHAHGDIGAYEDAATQCFDRHDQKSLSARGHLMDVEQGEYVIDTCANIKCS